MERSLRIIGGGLAGLTLGILLRKEGIPVELWEAGAYPRHRVCGEFISGRGVALLHRLEMAGELPGIESNTVRFFVNGQGSQVMKLPQPALCISRHDLDQRMAVEFTRLGGELHVSSRWPGSFSGPGTIRATGRRLEPGKQRPSFVGLKVHARNLPLAAGLELHFSRAGYAGLCQLANGVVNICGLFRAGVEPGARRDALTAFAPILGDRGRKGEIEEGSFCSVAGVSTGFADWTGSTEFRLGDSIAVIPPLTGNGMSLALESAFLAAPVVAAYSRGGVEWPRASSEFSQSCKRSFHRRLLISSILQKLLFEGRAGNLFLSCLRTAPGLLHFFFKLTR